MTKTWFYHYSGGYCGTDEYGLVIAETEEEALDHMLPDAMEHAENWEADPRGGNGENSDCEIETDLYVEPYEPSKHNMHLNGSEEGYIPDDE